VRRRRCEPTTEERKEEVTALAKTGSLRRRRASRSPALQQQPILAYPESHEREGLKHRGSLALWWAVDRKHTNLHAEGAAGPTG
jgi:hypothetical protein